jgi:S-adenosylmethionine synthetase
MILAAIAAGIYADDLRIHGVGCNGFDKQKASNIVKQLNLLRPIYSKTTNDGHFGKIDYKDITWELTNKADVLKKAAK